MSSDVRAKLARAFQEVDSDHSGSIDSVELEKVLTSYYKATGRQVDCSKIKREAAAFLKDVDKNNDKKISQEEFIQYFLKFC